MIASARCSANRFIRLTFHDYCLDLLKRAGKDFGVLDEKDLWIYLRKRIHELHLEHYVRAANVGQFLNDLLGFLSRCHDELVTPEKYAEYVARLERGESPVPRVAKSKDQLSDAEVIARCQEIARVFATTERWLREENLGTFGHMITRAHELLTTDQSLLAAERARTRFILVDEFQDANFAQIKILAALAGAEANVFGVGDPDQAIYRFRGASSAAFHLFRRHFPQTKLVVLGKNRRSTTPILQCAFAVVDKNPPVFARGRRLSPTGALLCSRRAKKKRRKEGKTLATFPVEAISFAAKDAEAPDVVRIIEETRRRSRCKWKDFGVLYRSHIHRDDVVQRTGRAGNSFLHREHGRERHARGAGFVCLRRGRGRPGIRCQSFSRSGVAAVRCGSGTTSGGAARDCQGIERGSRDSAGLGARRSRRRPRRAWTACARRAMKSTRSRRRRAPLCS